MCAIDAVVSCHNTFWGIGGLDHYLKGFEIYFSQSFFVDFCINGKTLEFLLVGNTVFTNQLQTYIYSKRLSANSLPTHLQMLNGCRNLSRLLHAAYILQSQKPR